MSLIINFREEDAFSLAHQDFISICGFKPESAKHQKMLASGMKIREQGLGRIDIKTLLSVCEPDVIRESAIEVDGVELCCDALASLDKDKVRKIIFYIITIVECGCESKEILDRLYADIWGTAYVNAAYGLFRQEMDSRYISGNEDLLLSDAFGPGYYGMPTHEIESFFKIMDAEKIGVQCLSSGIMIPVKSCAGFLLVLEKGAKVPEEHCKHCIGNSNGCQFCVHFKI